MPINELFTREEYEDWLSREPSYEFAHELARLLVHKSVEEMLRILPGVINNLVKNAVMLRDLSDRFYEQNRDLVAHKDIVARVIEGLESKAPGADLDKLLEEAAPIARKQIRMRK